MRRTYLAEGTREDVRAVAWVPIGVAGLFVLLTIFLALFAFLVNDPRRGIGFAVLGGSSAFDLAVSGYALWWWSDRPRAKDASTHFLIVGGWTVVLVWAALFVIRVAGDAGAGIEETFAAVTLAATVLLVPEAIFVLGEHRMQRLVAADVIDEAVSSG